MYFWKLDKDKAPDFSQWLNHSEDTIKLFSMRLINYFQQSYNCEKLEEFIHSENPLLKNEALNTIQNMKPGHHFEISKKLSA